jgi:hypothetical protein
MNRRQLYERWLLCLAAALLMLAADGAVVLNALGAAPSNDSSLEKQVSVLRKENITSGDAVVRVPISTGKSTGVAVGPEPFAPTPLQSPKPISIYERARSITSYFAVGAWERNAVENSGSFLSRLRYSIMHMLERPGENNIHANDKKKSVKRHVRVAEYGTRQRYWSPYSTENGVSSVADTTVLVGSDGYYMPGEATALEAPEVEVDSEPAATKGYGALQEQEQDMEVERELAQLSTVIVQPSPGHDAAAAAPLPLPPPPLPPPQYPQVMTSDGGVLSQETADEFASSAGGRQGGEQDYDAGRNSLAEPSLRDTPEPSRSGGGVGGGGDNVTQLANMVYKVAKEEGIRTLAAAPCRTTATWMPAVVARLEFEIPGLKFYCVDTDASGADGEDGAGPRVDLAAAFRASTSVTVLSVAPAETGTGFPADVELVVSWMGMQKWGVRKAWRFIKGLRRRRVKMGLFGNNPESGNAETEDKRTLNVRKSPMLFNEPLRVISRVGGERDKPKQLLLYPMDSIRDGF